MVLRSEIDDDQRLMLRLVFHEGHAVAQAARMLGLKRHQVKRPLERALLNIRSVLEANGLTLQSLEKRCRFWVTTAIIQLVG